VTPLPGVFLGLVLAVGHVDQLDLAQGRLVADPLHDLPVQRFVLDTVSDHQQAIGSLACIDHRLALGNRIGHGLFAEHVLAGFCRAYCE
jgi:hypothetical protein